MCSSDLGYHGVKQEPDFLRQKAYEIGYPVLIKAVAGGGGKGMRRVDRALDFEAALASAQREARNAFGDGRVLVEKYVLSPRHVEVQVFADGHGNVVHLFERDCSLQRRHQKVIEEAPAPGMTQETRDAMGRAAVEAARAVGYVGAGTVEFIADARDGLRADRFFFMEMNTRLQVEHPVTEAITGLDLVELQLRVASGESLPFEQEELRIDGHAAEARLYAEDPERGFLPSTGKLWALRFPAGEGLRIDTGVVEGDEVTPFYDPMIAKVIAHGPDRETALSRLSSALAATRVAGPRTNVAFLKALADAPDFRAGLFDTGFIDRNLDALGAVRQGIDEGAVCLGALHLLDREISTLARSGPAASPWDACDGFQLVGAREQVMPLVVDGARHDVSLAWAAPGPGGAGETDVVVRVGGASDHRLGRYRDVPEDVFVERGDGVYVLDRGRQTFVAAFDPFAVDLEHLDAGDSIVAPMHGKLVALFVQAGERVEKGQRLAVVEAMKMEHALLAPRDGVVAEVSGEPGAQVAEGARLVTLEAEGG